jgi:hypothetical protein
MIVLFTYKKIFKSPSGGFRGLVGCSLENA